MILRVYRWFCGSLVSDQNSWACYCCSAGYYGPSDILNDGLKMPIPLGNNGPNNILNDGLEMSALPGQVGVPKVVLNDGLEIPAPPGQVGRPEVVLNDGLEAQGGGDDVV